MTESTTVNWIAFAGTRRVASGAPGDVALQVKAFVDGDPDASVLIFDAHSSHVVELDLRGSASAVLRRLPRESAPEPAPAIETAASESRGPGRPKLGVVAREVTLLPRHWDWLASQPGGASVALRKLVEQARRASRETDRLRAARDAAYRFMLAVAGDAPGFEEASRALFANDVQKLRAHIARWPRDVRAHLLSLFELATAQPREEGAGPP